MTKPAPLYLKDAWYMAAWSEEIGQTPLRRRLIEQPILLYRLEDGSVAALTDRCPHRFAPLSAGQREGDAIRCGYHGLTFDARGQCIHNPFAPSIPKGANVRSWPIHEHDGVIWLWAGEPACADASAIPDFGLLSGAGSVAPLQGYMPMQAPYEFATDNLMDLSHIEFVHRGSFAGAGVIFAGKHEVRQEGATLHSNWWMPKVAAPGHTFGIYERGMPTDHWLDMRWNAPASMLLEVGATPVDAPRDQGVVVYQAHIITPETANSAHYFWATTRAGGIASEQGDAMLRALMGQAFNEEDKPIIEAAYANLDGTDFWEAQPVFLGIDAGGTRARRLLQSMIAAEQKSFISVA